MDSSYLEFATPGELSEGDLRLDLDSFALQPVHKVPAYHFRMVHKVTSEELGTIRLRVGSTRHIELYAGHVGYAVIESHRGHRYAARSVQLLMPFARRIGLNPLWITCDPENLASRRSLESIGAEFVEIIEVPKDCIIHQTGHPLKCRYRLNSGPSV